MEKFCSNCGKKLKENADVCLNCGVLVNKHNKFTKEKAGKGMSIAGMILGILAICLALPESFDYDFYINIEMIFDRILAIAVTMTGLTFSIIGFIKNKNGYNIAGIVLNTIAIAIMIIVILIICLI